MEQVSSDLHALKTLYGLLHKGPADEYLDETSRAFLMRMLDDATQQALLRQAKMLSGSLMSPALERKLSIQPDRRTPGDAVPPRLKTMASPSPSFHASERSRRLNLQGSVRSRDSRHGHESRLLARVASNRSSKTAVPPHRRQSPERRLACLASRRSSGPAAAMPQHRTVAGGTPCCSDRRVGHGLGRSPGRGDQSSLERGSGRCRSLSSEPQAEEGERRLHRAASAARRVGVECTSARRLGRRDSGLSVSIVSPRGNQLAGAAARSKLSSSSDAAVTIRSRIRPNRDVKERCLRRAGEAEEESPPRRRRDDVADAASASIGRSSRARRTLSRVDSGSTCSSSSSGANASSPCTRPREQSTSGASASSSSVSPRGRARPEDESEASRSRHLRRCRRERQERREERMTRLKNKLAVLFHHRHDHHHHHHFRRSGSPEGRTSRRDRGDRHRMSPCNYLGGVFHRATGHDEKKTTGRTAVRTPAKRRGGGGGHVHAMFDTLARRAAARAGMKRTGSLVQVKKLHWWQRMRRRRDRAGRRSGHGKAV